jgi:flagellar basal-body rod protein FlgG
VLDAGGRPIAIGTGEGAPSELRISPNGTIGNPATGQTWGPVALAVFPDAGSLRPVGKGLYTDPKNQRTTQAADGVQQGFLEGSNVDSLQELVQMITVERSFTATQKALSGLGRLQENLITNILR